VGVRKRQSWHQSHGHDPVLISWVHAGIRTRPSPQFRMAPPRARGRPEPDRLKASGGYHLGVLRLDAVTAVLISTYYNTRILPAESDKRQESGLL
jgi:hypothetical protein